MKLLVGISRVLVGVLFIFSGFIKLNDPLGFSYKLQEYFSPEVLGLEFLVPYSLVIAIILVVFELVVGIMILIGYLPKFTVWALLLMIVFFTFLTFYSAYFNKVTDCGCFGDAIPLTPWQSFIKDVILLIFILILFFNRKLITPVLNPISHRWIIFLSFMLSFWFAYHVLMHLPVFDFRAYKIGNNIKELMQVPEDAQKAVYEYEWTFRNNGEEITVTTDGSYPGQEGEFVKVETTMIEEGYVPPIQDFEIEANGEEITDEILDAEKLFMVIAYDLSHTEQEGFKAIQKLAIEAEEKGYKVVGLTASNAADQQKIRNKFKLNFEFYQVDKKALQTIVRSNPGLLVLEKGTISQKKHWFDAEDIKL
ncbi:DoxX family protein [Salegentibacter sp. JZCK2]|uniref:BT_3928 family protein n=1 Tax=Salegentibacter tibetensis TaxID=2873600 RepID=UPI001CCE3367|nr:BT_3928 family protein [Salegentibacter tibetensis]MBZ9731245.1 DoxX family protein [Salegentibacter tibetensis]